MSEISMSVPYEVLLCNLLSTHKCLGNTMFKMREAQDGRQLSFWTTAQWDNRHSFSSEWQQPIYSCLRYLFSNMICLFVFAASVSVTLACFISAKPVTLTDFKRFLDPEVNLLLLLPNPSQPNVQFLSMSTIYLHIWTSSQGQHVLQSNVSYCFYGFSFPKISCAHLLFLLSFSPYYLSPGPS